MANWNSLIFILLSSLKHMPRTYWTLDSPPSSAPSTATRPVDFAKCVEMELPRRRMGGQWRWWWQRGGWHLQLAPRLPVWIWTPSWTGWPLRRWRWQRRPRRCLHQWPWWQWRKLWGRHPHQPQILGRWSATPILVLGHRRSGQLVWFGFQLHEQSEGVEGWVGVATTTAATAISTAFLASSSALPMPLVLLKSYRKRRLRRPQFGRCTEYRVDVGDGDHKERNKDGPI